MKTLSGIIIFLTLVLCTHVFAGGVSIDGMGAAEQLLVEKINAARLKPIETAVRFGVDIQAIRQINPELAAILDRGLTQFRIDPCLNESARFHTQEMLQKDFYGYSSPGGPSAQERILSAGYEPVLWGESLGVVAFLNYMQISEAVEAVFKNLFLDEFKPDRSEPRNILNSELTDIGIAFGTGSLTFQGRRYNVYVATCDFGTRKPYTVENSDLELVLVQWMNHLRQNPLTALAERGWNTQQLLLDLPELEGVLIRGLPPLALNDRLGNLSRDRISQIFTHRINGSEPPVPDDFQSLSSDYGYLPYVGGETIHQQDVGVKTDPLIALQLLFDQMVQEELTVGKEKRLILNPEIQEAGVAAGKGFFTQEGMAKRFDLAVCEFGMSSENPMDWVLEYVNRIRREPAKALKEIGVKPDALLARLSSEIGGEMKKELPPLRLNPRLHSSALDHARELFNRGELSNRSVNGKGPIERAAEKGYSSEIIEEAFDIISLCNPMPPERIISSLVRKILAEEVRLIEAGQTAKLLNPNVQEIGVGFLSGKTYGFGSICEDIYLVVLTVGRPAGGVAESLLTGIVYHDLNGNQVFELGEGVPRLLLSCEGPAGLFYLLTNGLGRFSMPVIPGSYELSGNDISFAFRHRVEIEERPSQELIRLDVISNP